MKYITVFILFSSSFVFLSCSGIEGVESVKGLMGTPPVRSLHNTDTSIVRISGEILTPINSPRKGRIQRDTSEIYNRYSWSSPKVAMTLDADVFLSRNPGGRSAISLGITSGYLGKSFYKVIRIGYAFEGNSEKYGFRFDLGTYFANISSESYVTWSDNPVPFNPYTPSNKYSFLQNQGGRYLSFTFGMHQPESRWSGDLQISMNWQGISGESNSINDEAATGLFYIAITPFASYRLSSKMHLVGGLRMIKESEIEGTNGVFIFVPFIQYELCL